MTMTIPYNKQLYRKVKEIKVLYQTIRLYGTKQDHSGKSTCCETNSVSYGFSDTFQMTSPECTLGFLVFAGSHYFLFLAATWLLGCYILAAILLDVGCKVEKMK